MLALVSNPAFTRAVVLGFLGGLSLVLVMRFSSRGALTFVPYAVLALALLALLALLARYQELSMAARVSAVLGGFLSCTLPGLIFVVMRSRRELSELRTVGKEPKAAPLGSAKSLLMVLACALIVAVAIAFISS